MLRPKWSHSHRLKKAPLKVIAEDVRSEDIKIFGLMCFIYGYDIDKPSPYWTQQMQFYNNWIPKGKKTIQPAPSYYL
jgi:hypothetical protein